MPKVGIYGWEYRLWDLSTWWGTGMGLGGTQVVVVDENSAMSYSKNTQHRHNKEGDTDGHNIDG